MYTVHADVLKRRIEWCLEIADLTIDEFGNVINSAFYDAKSELDGIKEDVDCLVELLKEVY